jgi:hypothetical protein
MVAAPLHERDERLSGRCQGAAALPPLRRAGDDPPRDREDEIEGVVTRLRRHDTTYIAEDREHAFRNRGQEPRRIPLDLLLAARNAYALRDGRDRQAPLRFMT